jgi:hypothetical protein
VTTASQRNTQGELVSQTPTRLNAARVFFARYGVHFYDQIILGD